MIDPLATCCRRRTVRTLGTLGTIRTIRTFRTFRTLRTLRTFCTVVVALLAALPAAAQPAKPLTPVLSEQRGLQDWDLDGNGSWAVHGNVLTLEKAGTPGGPIRRPAAIAVLKSRPLESFTLRLELRSTAPVDLAVRDVLLIFGYQSPSRFYYVHLSAKTDPVHNGIFVVNDADRRRLDEPTSKARLLDQSWRKVRLERDAGSGRVAVFFDDESVPALEASDRTLTSGRVGVGSFDETGEFRSISITPSPPAR
jgi:hypothetical protein